MSDHGPDMPSAHRTERATPVDWKVFYYEHMVDAVDELGDNDLMAELERAGIRVEDL
ncbi:MAG: hypothetical protein KA125_01815 [Chromatiaceae bacterium]|nr:hypothetical protein [Chromatiaceae bacterium]